MHLFYSVHFLIESAFFVPRGLEVVVWRSGGASALDGGPAVNCGPAVALR